MRIYRDIFKQVQLAAYLASDNGGTFHGNRDRIEHCAEQHPAFKFCPLCKDGCMHALIEGWIDVQPAGSAAEPDTHTHTHKVVTTHTHTHMLDLC